MNPIDVCNEFALKHKVIFEEKGEVGIGRLCVGFVRGDGYVDYNPYRFPDLLVPVWEIDHRLCPPPTVPDAYHKHDCLAVLVHNDDYDEAKRQLALWVLHLVGQGEVEVVEYETGATGLQAAFTGTTGYAVRFKNP
jgi:hypothetical protein